MTYKVFTKDSLILKMYLNTQNHFLMFLFYFCNSLNLDKMCLK